MPSVPAPINATEAPELWPRLDPGFIEFNPSFARCPDGRILGVIRRDHYPPTPGRGMVWSLPLDEDLRPVGPPAILIPDGEDPRVLLHGEDVLVFYVHFERDLEARITGTSVRMAVCALHGGGLEVTAIFPLPKNPLGGPAGADALAGWEKNWVPFALDEARLGIIYRQDPWEVLILNRSQGGTHFEQAYRAEGLTWAWGGIRGGTPPIPYDDGHLVSFFHSSEVLGSRKLYMVGAVVFSRQAPFAPVAMTRDPLLVAPYKGGVHRHGWPVAASVIFPLGADRQGGDFRLLSGVDDGEVGLFRIPAAALAGRLGPLGESRPGMRLQAMTGPAQTLPAPVWRLPDGQAKLEDRALLRFLQILCPEGRCLVDLGAQAGLLAACMGSRYREAHAIACSPEETALLPGNAALNQLDHLTDHADFGVLAGPAWAAREDVDLLRVAGGAISCSLLELAGPMVERSRPVILVEAGTLAPAREACAAWLAERGYGIEWPFGFCPQWALAIPAEKRPAFDWFL